MTAKLEFQPIAADDRHWWDIYQRRCQEINKMVREQGSHSFYRLRTFEGKEYRVYVQEADGARLYIGTGSVWTHIAIKKVAGLSRDEKAIEDYNRLSDSTEREKFLRAWHEKGDRYIPPELR
jgi:NAD-dependent SIR2 family protein deacetylase